MTPTLPPTPQESAPEYAARVLRAILADSTHLHAYSSEDLARVDMAAQRAAAQMPTDKETRSTAPTLHTLQRLTETRHLIAQVITHRQQREAQRFADLMDAIQSFPTNGSGGGSRTPLTPPVPQLPPQGYAQVTPQMIATLAAIGTAQEAQANGTRPTTKPDGFNIDF